MKILFVDTYDVGHHFNYAQGIIDTCTFDTVYAIFPQPLEHVVETYIYRTEKQTPTLSEYLKLVMMINELAAKIDPDVIHFLTCNYLLRYFGFGIKQLGKRYKVIISLHQYKENRIKNISIKRICKAVKYEIVHSEIVFSVLKSKGIGNIKFIDYPYFGTVSEKRKTDIKKELGFRKTDKIIGYFGETRYDKGIDIFIKAINERNDNINVGILIAGKTTYFSQDYLTNNLSKINKYKIIDRFLTNEEMADYINASDYVVLPYRKSFSGASGTMIEAVMHKKIIIGADSGLIGEYIKNYKLGYVFEAENAQDLTETIEYAVNNNFEFSDSYFQYLNKISYLNFCGCYQKYLKNETAE